MFAKLRCASGMFAKSFFAIRVFCTLLVVSRGCEYSDDPLSATCTLAVTAPGFNTTGIVGDELTVTWTTYVTGEKSVALTLTR